MKFAIGVLIAVSCGPALAGPNTCDALSAAIDASLKEISYASVAGTFDDSASRETNRQLRRVVESNLLQANLVLLQANKCPLPKVPTDGSAYKTDASKCVVAARRIDIKGGSEEPPECDRNTWKR